MLLCCHAVQQCVGVMHGYVFSLSMWHQGHQSWMQYASKAPASRLDVINLQEALDEKLMERQAREMGVCPVREDLYSQCFGSSAVQCAQNTHCVRVLSAVARWVRKGVPAAHHREWLQMSSSDKSPSTPLSAAC